VPTTVRHGAKGLSEFPHCTVCQAPISLRATTCAVCDAPAPPLKKAIPSGEIRSGEWVRFKRPPDELKDLYKEVVESLAPDIRILGMAGEGGMALVFVGRDMTLKREVAIKLLSPKLADDEVARKRFTREAEAIAAVNHPNVVNVYHVGELPGSLIPYFVMQFVDGPTLGMGALRGRMLTEVRVRRLMADVSEGLAAAHRRKVFHRDIKPGNIVLDGETGRAMVLDFGISAAASSRRGSLSSRLTEEGMYLGTPTYMSPEQGGGEELTDKSDVYSLGILAFELLMGHPPFEGQAVAVMAAHVNTVPPRLDSLREGVSPELATLIEKCLEKDPAKRPSAQDIFLLLSPDDKQVVEWPPPGMARVRAAGVGLLNSAAWLATAVAVFFGVMSVWPDLAVLSLASGGGQAGMIRSFALGASLATIVASAGMFVVYVLLSLSRRRWAIASGYPAWVVTYVICDSRRDSGDLMNGTGDFALVPGVMRHQLLSFRSWRFWIQVLGAIIAIGGATQWVLAWLAAGFTPPSQTIALLWATPIVAVFVIYLVAGIPEWRVRRIERAKSLGDVKRTSAPKIKGELVNMWLASAEKARKSFSGSNEAQKDPKKK
jgi:tRNA A-37 threonylcarbamoyl transferase component Bud32